MARYYFHVDGSARDTQGCMLPDLSRAKCEAVTMAGRLLCDDSKTFWEKKEWGMTVTDADDLTLFALTFFATEGASITTHHNHGPA